MILLHPARHLENFQVTPVNIVVPVDLFYHIFALSGPEAQKSLISLVLASGFTPDAERIDRLIRAGNDLEIFRVKAG